MPGSRSMNPHKMLSSAQLISASLNRTGVRPRLIPVRPVNPPQVRHLIYLPRILSPTFWRSMTPSFLRRDPRPAESAATTAPKTKRRNKAAGTYILLAMLIGSQSLQLLNLRTEVANFTRETEARLELLRETIRRVRAGEDVDVKGALGTGDPKKEREWEEVVKELLEDDAVFEPARRKRRWQWVKDRVQEEVVDDGKAGQ